MRKFLVLFTSLMLSGVLAFAQTHTVSGTVNDESGTPVPYATVVEKGTRNATTADANGNLAEIVLNDNLSFGTDWDKLRAYIIDLIGSSSPNPDEGPEVEIDIDYNIRYEHVIQAITSVTGRKQGNDIIRLIDRIKFAPPRKG